MKSQLESRVNRNYPTCQICVRYAFEAGVFNLFSPLRLLREHPNRLNQVLVRVFITRDYLAQLWDYIKGVEVIELLETWHNHLRKLETHKSTTWSQDAIGLAQGFVSIRNVSYSESYRVKIHRITLHFS